MQTSWWKPKFLSILKFSQHASPDITTQKPSICSWICYLSCFELVYNRGDRNFIVPYLSMDGGMNTVQHWGRDAREQRPCYCGKPRRLLRPCSKRSLNLDYTPLQRNETPVKSPTTENLSKRTLQSCDRSFSFPGKNRIDSFTSIEDECLLSRDSRDADSIFFNEIGGSGISSSDSDMFESDSGSFDDECGSVRTYRTANTISPQCAFKTFSEVNSQPGSKSDVASRRKLPPTPEAPSRIFRLPMMSKNWRKSRENMPLCDIKTSETAPLINSRNETSFHRWGKLYRVWQAVGSIILNSLRSCACIIIQKLYYHKRCFPWI